MVMWIGGEGGMEVELVKRLDIPFEAIPAAGVHGVGLRSLPGNIARLVRGYGRAREIVDRFDPDVLFFTGGYIGVPVSLAAMRKRKVLYVPDIEPALALRTLAYISDKITLTVKDSKEYFSDSWGGRLEVTGYPVREEFKNKTRESAREALGLKPDLPVLLITGGSKGARSINNAVMEDLPELLPDIQVIHTTGQLDWDDVQGKFAKITQKYPGKSWLQHYHPFAFLHDMGSALAAADLVVSRSGASVLGEYPYFGLPAILVPYPYAWRYQKVNADWLQKRGAAVIVLDDQLTTNLVPTIRELLDKPQKLELMRKASRQLAQPDAAYSIADILVQQVDNQGRREEC